MTHNKRNLPEADLYRFLGREILIHSNSFSILEHFRFMYKRFYTGKEISADPNAKKRSSQQFAIHIEDQLDSSNQLIIKDNFSLYRLSKADGAYKYTYRDIKEPSRIFEGISDPLSLMSIVLLRSISRLLDDYGLIHAGAVSWNGNGIIFPAQANMGKTSIVLKLLSRKFEFLSDEIACLNPQTNQLEPFPRAVNVRENTRHLLGLKIKDSRTATAQQPYEQVYSADIEAFAENSLSLPVEARYLIFLKGIGEKPGLENLSPSHALFNLMQFVLSTCREAPPLLMKFAPAVDRLQCFNLVMGNIDATADLIYQLVNETSSAERTARHVS